MREKGPGVEPPGPSVDHPFDLSHPEGEYLKGLLCGRVAGCLLIFGGVQGWAERGLWVPQNPLSLTGL